MTIPVSKITVWPGGHSIIDGQEKVDDCHKLGEMAEAAGKIESRKKKDHTPVYQDVHAKAKGGN